MKKINSLEPPMNYRPPAVPSLACVLQGIRTLSSRSQPPGFLLTSMTVSRLYYWPHHSLQLSTHSVRQVPLNKIDSCRRLSVHTNVSVARRSSWHQITRIVEGTNVLGATCLQPGHEVIVFVLRSVWEKMRKNPRIEAPIPRAPSAFVRWADCAQCVLLIMWCLM